MTFGQRLRQLRLSKGMTVVRLGEATGLSQAYISSLENGSRQSPTLKTIRRLAEALSVPVEELLEDAGAHGKKLQYLSPDVSSWLAREENTPYLRLAMQLSSRQIPPDRAEKLCLMLEDVLRYLLDDDGDPKMD